MQLLSLQSHQQLQCLQYDMNVRLVPLPQIDFCIHRASLDSVKKMHERYRRMIIGSHDSCTESPKNPCLCICWPWAKTQSFSLEDQFKIGVRLFDLRYHLEDDTYYISHTFSTNYTVQQALTDLVSCAMDSEEYVYIRLKRDSSSVPLPEFGTALDRIMINSISLGEYVVRYDGRILWDYMNKKPYNNKCIIIYSDNDTLRDDNVVSSWIFPQLFDTVETWDCSTVDDAIQRIHDKNFKQNGLPRAIFVDFSGLYPPKIAFEYVWEQVKDMIVESIVRKEIDCVMVNYANPEIVNMLYVLSLD